MLRAVCTTGPPISLRAKLRAWQDPKPVETESLKKVLKAALPRSFSRRVYSGITSGMLFGNFAIVSGDTLKCAATSAGGVWVSQSESATFW